MTVEEAAGEARERREGGERRPGRQAGRVRGRHRGRIGEHIAFTSGRDKNGQTCFEECQPSDEIYVADADGANPRRLTNEEAQDASPTWSPAA